MKDKRIIYIIIILFIVITIVLLGNKIKNNKTVNMDNYIDDYINKPLDTVEEDLKKLDIIVDIKYEYNGEVPKDKIISQSIVGGTKIKAGDKLELKVSLGELDKKKLAEDGINELGKVPIMMYHGIKDMKDEDTNNTGGNVDKDGYTRTSESFRRDLEFFYKNNYRMIKISDYIEGNIDVPYGKSPIILTFDDGNANNIKVTNIDESGNITIDPNCAVGILEEFKKKYPDFQVTASFYITANLFNQEKYDEQIIKWLVDNGYEVGNHTQGHNNFTKIDEEESEKVVGFMYNKLNTIIPGKYLKVVALPFGSPYKLDHPNYSHIINSFYDGVKYETKGALRVGWEPELSPFHKEFNPLFMKRCRAYDNNGKEFDIDMVFNKILSKNRYISDGNVLTIITTKNNLELINNINDKMVITY